MICIFNHYRGISITYKIYGVWLKINSIMIKSKPKNAKKITLIQANIQFKIITKNDLINNFAFNKCVTYHDVILGHLLNGGVVEVVPLVVKRVFGIGSVWK